MKLTAKLLKKIIREAIGSVPGPYGGVRGIGKFYSDEKGKLGPESARQAVDLSSILAMDPDDDEDEEKEPYVSDLETEDLDETIFIEVKEIIADFVDQYYQNFLERVNEAEGGDNYPDEFDPIPGVRQKVDAIINKIYFTQPESQIRALVDAIRRSVPYRRNMFKISRLSSREEKKAERLLLKQFIDELEKLNDFFKSYDDLLAALSPESQKVLKSLSIEDKINDRIQKHAQTVKASQAIKVRPVSDYQNMIRLAKTKQEVATIFNVFKAHMVGLRKFMGDYMTSHYGYDSMFIAPRELIIDPEKIKTVHHEKDYSWTENAPRKAIDYLDNRDQEKPIGKIMNEIESYISDAISGEFVGRYAHPKVKQGFMPKKFPMSEAILKKLIYEELSFFLTEQEDEDFTSQFEVLFSSDAEQIIQGLRLADSLSLTPEQLPFERLDLSKQNIPDPADLLRVAETVMDTYGDYIVSYLRKKLVAAMEKGLRRRLEKGMTTGLKHPADRIRTIIKNELTSHKRKINVIGSPNTTK